MFDLSGKTALITGASGGIGVSIAKALHAQGAHIGISGRNEEKLQALAGELGGRVSVLAADLSNDEAIATLKRAVELEPDSSTRHHWLGTNLLPLR